MTLIGRFVAFAALLFAAMSVGWPASAAAQETSGEYREALNGIHTEMNALTLEIENFRVNSRYCRPPQIPSKAEAQADLEALAKRAEALNQRYNDLKQSLKDFAKNPRVAAELMLRDIDPTDDRWFSSYEAARRRMLDALQRKRAALAAAPEIDCRPKPKPKPKPAVTTGGFQPPAMPQRPVAEALATPPFPSHFCSWDEYWAFVHRLNLLAERAAENAERAAKFRADVERAINAYVQNDRPVPRQLLDQRRQANADTTEAGRRLAEADANVRRAKAIPVIDCRQPQQEPPPAEPPQTGQAPQTTKDLPQSAQGLTDADMSRVAQQQRAIDEVEQAFNRVEEARKKGDCKRWDDLFDDLHDSIGLGIRIVPTAVMEEWKARVRRAVDAPCPPEEKAPPPTPVQPNQTGFIRPADRRMAIILEEHNKARAEVGSPPLQWDPQLAAGAVDYAQQLARTGQRVHAPREGRGVVRENLNQGMLGWTPTQMMQNWLRERQNFIPGTYPNVTKTGRWQDVSHYTQMIWPKTTHVGCGLTSGRGYQWLVCRYSPGGNRDGSPILADNSGIAPPNSSTPTNPPFDPRSLPKLPMGGGMTQIDPPPPPPPTARDEAPEGNEELHPLVTYAVEADARHAEKMACGDTTMARPELEKMRYALDELRKRLKAARKVGRFSAIKADDVQRQVERLFRMISEAEQRRPGERCQTPPPPHPKSDR